MNTTPSTEPRFPPHLGTAFGFRGRSRKTLVLAVGAAVVLLVVIVLALSFARRGTPLSLSLPDGISGGVSKVSDVPLTKAYQNPFERETQYVNPFQELKSPFQSLQQ